MYNYLIITVAALMATSLNAYSGVEATNFLLQCDAGGNATITYQTPPGKVLVLQHIIRESATSEVRCTLSQAGLLTYTLCSGSPEHTTFSPAYLIVGDAQGSGELKLVNGSNNWAVVVGLLADQSDMYASIPSQFTDGMYANGNMTLGVQLASARPSIMKIDKSSDLSSWLPAQASIFNQGGGQLEAIVSANEPKQFFRAKARARKRK